MISLLSGKIIQIEENYLILDVNGVGYKILCSYKALSLFREVKENVTILTELIVREDSLTLYGFFDKDERVWFNLLQSVQGVGSKASLAILSSVTSDKLASAILSQDKGLITRAEGVGPKIANRIINELRDKVPSSEALFSSSFNDEDNQKDSLLVKDAISALVNLGYSKNDSYKTVREVFSKSDKNINISNLITLSLNKLK